MIRLAMSPAAAALFRALVDRCGKPREQVLLTHLRTTEWRSLTFDGERHELMIRINGPDVEAATDRVCDGLEDAEFSLGGAILADIRIVRRSPSADGSSDLEIEALTVMD